MKKITLLLAIISLLLTESCHKRLDVYPVYSENSLVVGPEGKRIQFENSSIILDIPPGALDQEVVLSLTKRPGDETIIVYDSLNNLYYSDSYGTEIIELLPAGLKFKKNISIQFVSDSEYKKIFRVNPGTDKTDAFNWSEKSFTYFKTPVTAQVSNFTILDNVCTSYFLAPSGSKTGLYLDNTPYETLKKNGMYFFEGYYYNQYEQDIDDYTNQVSFPIQTSVAFAEKPLIGKTYKVYNSAKYGQLSLDSVAMSDIFCEQNCINGNCAENYYGLSGEVVCLYQVNEYGNYTNTILLKNVMILNTYNGKKKRLNGFLSY